MLELWLDKERYERFETCRSDLLFSFYLSTAIFVALIIAIAYLSQGHGDPLSFKVTGLKRAGQGRKNSGKGDHSPQALQNMQQTADSSSKSTEIMTRWGCLQRDPTTGKILLNSDLLELLAQCNRLDVPAIREAPKPKQPEPTKEVKEKKAKKPVVKKLPKQPKNQAKQKEEAKPVIAQQAVPTKSELAHAKLEAEKERAEKEKKNALKKTEMKHESDKLKTAEAEIGPPKTITPRAQSQEPEPPKRADNAGRADAVNVPSSMAQAGLSGDGKKSGGQGGGVGDGVGYAVEGMGGIGIEFIGSRVSTGEPDAYYRAVIEEINAIINDRWNPLAGWEDAGPVTVEIAIDKDGVCKTKVCKPSKAGSKNSHALAVARLVGSTGKIRGRKFNLTFT